MEIDCDALVERFLLIKNPLYTFNFPISILVAIVVYGVMKAYKLSTNSYITQILAPLSSLLVSMVLIDMLCRAMINQDEKDKLNKLCLSYMNDPNKKKKMFSEKALDMYDVQNYDGKVDGFKNVQDEQYMNEPDLDPLDREMDTSKHIYDNVTTTFIPNPSLDGMKPEGVGSFPKDDIMCVGDSKSTDCNLCSGSGKNPAKIIAPVPGPQWLPQNAETVQRRLKTNNYTKNRCMGEPNQF